MFVILEIPRHSEEFMIKKYIKLHHGDPLNNCTMKVYKMKAIKTFVIWKMLSCGAIAEIEKKLPFLRFNDIPKSITNW